MFLNVAYCVVIVLKTVMDEINNNNNDNNDK
jgi:hypothetical protein